MKVCEGEVYQHSKPVNPGDNMPCILCFEEISTALQKKADVNSVPSMSQWKARLEKMQSSQLEM